jgi:hypothetical protein
MPNTALTPCRYAASRKGTPMRVETLLSPGILSNGFLLRREAAKAISAIEITARVTPGGKTRAAAALSAFFTDCASKLSTLTDATAPTMAGSTATVASATSISLAFAEVMDQSVIPAASAFTVNNGGTVSSLAWASSTVLTITGTGYAAGDTVTYTKPETNGLRDLAGNQVATGSKVSV